MRLKKLHLPLIALAISFAGVSAADVFGQEGTRSRDFERRGKRVVASGRFTGTREPHQVVTWQSRGAVYLAVETRGARPRVLWQTDGGTSAYRVDSIRVADIDGNGVPEILSLWWERSTIGGQLRVFQWDPRQNSFIELQSENEINRVSAYRVIRAPGSRSNRIVIDRRSGGRSSGTGIAYELRGSRLVRVGGDSIVTTQGDSGIEGQAVLSPVRGGPIRQGIPNSAPYKTTLVVWRVDGDREVARFDTGSDGRFRVKLAPGTYRVGPPPQTGRFLPRAAEETVTVEPGKFARLTINFDSGMR